MASEGKKGGVWTTVANVIWIIFGGLFNALAWCILGVILCITIIGIPFGKQCFKFAAVALTPFGRTIQLHYGAHPIMNTIWLILFGWGMALSTFFMAIINFITIIGIPGGIAGMKLAKLSLAPFGADY